MQAQYEAYEAEAYKRGCEAARAAAMWITDGNDGNDNRRRKLEMFEAGGPVIFDYSPQPNLSGEWADDPTPRSLFEEITGYDAHAEATWNHERYDEVVDAICDAWERGVSEISPFSGPGFCWRSFSVTVGMGRQSETLEAACVAELRKWLEP